ncbi:WecB/TagA/CpsF family glycosyltransferase [Myxosarcina sp. GI1(2024)]
MTFNFNHLERDNANFISQLEKSEADDKLPTSVELLNRKITLIDDLSLIKAIHKTCLENKQMTIALYNVHSFNISMQLPWFFEFQQSSDYAICDGVGIIKALQYMGLKVPLQYRVSPTNLTPKLIEHCNRHNLSIFLLGTKTKLVQQAIQKVKAKYPNLKIAGHHGYFDQESPEQNQAVINLINSFKPNILLVCMGVPLQEKWLLKNRPFLNANIFLPCGAVIDRLAGIVHKCPQLISNIGFEWLYRLIWEPRRLAGRYLLGNPAFLLQIALAKSMGLLTYEASKKKRVNLAAEKLSN